MGTSGRTTLWARARWPLLSNLGGSNLDARTGGGIAKGKVLYIVFPYSAKKRTMRWPVTNQEINDQAMQLLTDVGGLDVFKSCSTLQ